MENLEAFLAFKSVVVGTEGEVLKPSTVVQGGSGKRNKFLGLQVA